MSNQVPHQLFHRGRRLLMAEDQAADAPNYIILTSSNKKALHSGLRPSLDDIATEPVRIDNMTIWFNFRIIALDASSDNGPGDMSTQ